MVIKSLNSEEVRNVRKELALTQAALAKKIHVSQVTIARWETGARQCSGVPMQRLMALQPANVTSAIKHVSALSWITRADLGHLQVQEATEFFREWLFCEARFACEPITSVQISTETSTPDGGIDAIIDGLGGTHLVNSKTYFQIKTGNNTEPWQKSWVKKELFGIRRSADLKNLGEAVRQRQQQADGTFSSALPRTDRVKN